GSSHGGEEQESQEGVAILGLSIPFSTNFHAPAELPNACICPYCNNSFSSTTSLKHHIRTHTGEKPFTCPHCSYLSSTKGNLKRHFRLHTGEKPFTCNFCPYRSADKSGLNRHICKNFQN
ncbi:unnamed protein product, partial [Meganyctiphanes norvegica]